VVIVGTALAACTDTAGPDPLILQIVDGDGQEAQAGTVLDSLTVKVTGLDGSPREDVAVSWAPWPGDGEIRPETVRSDAEGFASASWTLGSDFGPQAVTVTAPGTDTLFQAWATPSPPSDWVEVLEIRPGAEIVGNTLLARVWVLNHWPGTLRLWTPKGNLEAVGYPAIYSANGDEFAHFPWGSWLIAMTYPIAPGDSLSWEWEIGIGGIEPGQYTLRFRFDVQKINGTPATLPDTETTVTIGG
jgi:hypothetical protein